MTAPPIITPLLQWSDADGNPYAGGSIETYVVGTSSPKQVWLDMEQTALATNPVILDSAGRSLMFGDGAYRLVLRDSVGNQVADFVATTLVSAAMYPVISAPTIADAVHQLGIDDMIAAEAAARAAADSAEQTARIAADAAETAAREAADATLTTAVGAMPLIQHGSAATDADGHKLVTFATHYSLQPSVVVTHNGTGFDASCAVVNAGLGSFDVWWAHGFDGSPDAVGFFWIAVGPA
jgi:hypothetical protein